MAGGRPVKFKDEYCDLAYNYCLLGADDAELASFFGVCEATINNWKNSHPKFLESLKAGKDQADAEIAKSLFQRAKGYSHPDTKFATFEGEITDSREYTKHYPPDTTAAIIWLKNRQSKKWRDKQDVEFNGKMEVTSYDEMEDDALVAEAIARGLVNDQG